jgi:hypothetical protein
MRTPFLVQTLTSVVQRGGDLPIGNRTGDREGCA